MSKLFKSFLKRLETLSHHYAKYIYYPMGALTAIYFLLSNVGIKWSNYAKATQDKYLLILLAAIIIICFCCLIIIAFTIIRRPMNKKLVVVPVAWWFLAGFYLFGLTLACWVSYWIPAHTTEIQKEIQIYSESICASELICQGDINKTEEQLNIQHKATVYTFEKLHGFRKLLYNEKGTRPFDDDKPEFPISLHTENASYNGVSLTKDGICTLGSPKGLAGPKGVLVQIRASGKATDNQTMPRIAFKARISKASKLKDFVRFDSPIIILPINTGRTYTIKLDWDLFAIDSSNESRQKVAEFEKEKDELEKHSERGTTPYGNAIVFLFDNVTKKINYDSDVEIAIEDIQYYSIKE